MKNKKILLVALPALLALPLGAKTPSSSFGVPRFQNGDILQEEYKINTLFSLPHLTKDGIEYTCTIEFPSGAAYALEEVRLSEVGVYKLHFSAEKEGKYYAEEASFKVQNPYIAFSGSSSSSSFEKSSRTYNKEGLFVSLAEGETLTFNAPLDLNQDADIIELFAAPSIIGSTDFTEFDIALTDLNDSENVLSIRAAASQEGSSAPYTYWAAKAPGQLYTGYESGFNTLHINDGFGTPVLHSFYGMYTNGTAGDAQLRITYDQKEKALYAGGMLVADFDDPTFFSALWDGFSSNEVTLSITAKGYSSSMANFVITSAAGMDLRQETIVDATAPVIDVQTPQEGVPTARIGLSYPVFKATAKDETDGECDVKVRAYYRYGTRQESLIPITSGSFPVEYEGEYALVYESSDKMGNVSQKVVKITTQAEMAEIQIQPVGSEIIKESKQGELYSFPAYEATGGSGPLSGVYKVTKDGQAYLSSTSSFIPKELGEYQITYTVTDYLGQSKEETYTLNVVKNENAILYDDIVMPRYLIADAVYTLPEAICYDYSSGTGVAVPMEVKISNDVFSYQTKGGESFVPKITGKQEYLRFEFSYKNLHETKEVLTVNPYSRIGGIDRFSIENYLLSDNLEFDIGDTDLGFYAFKKGHAGFVLANPLIAEGSSVTLASEPGKENFTGIAVTLRDSENESEAVTVNLTKNGSVVYFGINGRSYQTGASFSKANNLIVSYSGGAIAFNGTGMNCRYYDDGSSFEGFSSGKVYYEVTLQNAYPGAGLRLTKFDNQSMSYASSDYAEPRIVIHGDYGGTYRHGDKATINRVEAGDVLDPNCTCTVSVRDPNGNVATSLDGIPLQDVSASSEHQIELSEYGQYIVTYTALDSTGNRASFIFALNVEDSLAPTIRITGSLPETIHVGQSVRIPAYEVEDDQDENVQVDVFVTTSHGESIYLGDHNAFKPLYAGTYEIRIRAMDASGNVSYATLPFEVIE